MITFEGNEMTCGHCAGIITKALKAQDKNANVQIDLVTRQVAIESSGASLQELGDAIKEAGYTPVTVERGGGSIAASGALSRGCCRR